MVDQLFDNKDVVETNDDVDVAAVKQKFTLEDGTVDVEGLLKKAAHADKHISHLETKLDETKAERDARLTYEALLAKIEASRATSSHDPQDPGERVPPRTPEAPPLDLDAKIEAKLNQKQQEILQQANVDFVAQELTKVWGENFQTKLNQRAKELSLDQETLRRLAVSNPKGFLNVVIPAQVPMKDTSFVPPKTRTNVGASTANPTKNQRYYLNKMKVDKRLATDVTFNNEMHEQAKLQGESFFE